MFLAPLLLAFPAPAPLADARAEVRKQFVELAGKQDREGCAKLWREHPDLVLTSIDADLEGSLKVREKTKPGEAPDEAKIHTLHERALWGAQVAFEALGQPIFRDYAAAFVGWNEDERTRFRAGQAAYGKAMQALQQGDAQAALAAGQECLQITGSLGDWWGSAMGCSAIASAQRSLGNHEKALESAAFARVLDHDLGLVSDEYEMLVLMTDECIALGRAPRARACIERGLEFAKRLGDAEGEKRLLSAREKLDAQAK